MKPGCAKVMSRLFRLKRSSEGWEFNRPDKAKASRIRSFEEIINGGAESIPEQTFLYVGSIDEVSEKAKWQTRDLNGDGVRPFRRCHGPEYCTKRGLVIAEASKSPSLGNSLDHLRFADGARFHNAITR